MVMDFSDEVKLVVSNFAQQFIGIQGRECHILGNFAFLEAKNRPANQPACTLNYK